MRSTESPPGVQTKRINIDGLVYSVTTAGEAGPPLLLLHGFTGSGATWLPLLAMFATRKRVVAVDLPGHGRTDAPEDPARYGIDRTVRDLLAVMDRLESLFERECRAGSGDAVASVPAGHDGNENTCRTTVADTVVAAPIAARDDGHEREEDGIDGPGAPPTHTRARDPERGENIADYVNSPLLDTHPQAWDPEHREGQSDGPGVLSASAVAWGGEDERQAGRAAAPVGSDPRGDAREGWAVLGYSMGGRVALHLALAAPERVASLVLEGASPGIADGDERRQRQEADWALAARIEREGIGPFVDYWEALPLFASQRRLPDGVQAGLRAGRLATVPLGLANSLRAAGAGAQEALHERLGALAMPVLLIAGEWDEKYRQLMGEMAGYLPRPRMAIIEGAGHAAHLEQPERFATAVAGFLESVSFGGSCVSSGGRA